MPAGRPGSLCANRTGTEWIDNGLDWGDWRGLVTVCWGRKGFQERL